MSQGITADQLADDVVTVLKKTLVLTDAQIKGLPSTPVEIIAAPGSGKLIVPLAGAIRSHIIAPYTNVESSGIVAFYFFLGPAGTAFGNMPSGIVRALVEADQIFQLCPGANEFFETGEPDVVNGVTAANRPKSSSPLSDAINQNLRVQIDNYTADYETNLGNLTDGDANNTLSVTVLYTIIDA